ncbi:MAG: polysaccharide pyruvyl transferase CsaB [Candidatus Rifleibacteriota bacterium]
MKILITGFFGEGNLGDETILRSLIGHIPATHSVLLTCGRYPMVSGPELIPRRGLKAWPQFLKAAADSEKAIFSGGILQDWTFEGITFFALRILAASILNAEPALWGAGLGPIRRVAAKRIVNRIMGRIKCAWLRDQYSLELFNAAAKRSGKLGTDWSWYFPAATTEMAFSHGPLGLNLRKWPFTEWKKYMATQMKHVDRQIIGIASRKSDTNIIKSMARKATIMTPETFEKAIELCQNLSYGIAMRYHIALAMLRAGLPIKVVAYDDKVKNLAQEAGIKTIQENSISGFRQASRTFIDDNEARFKRMQAEFIKFVTE